MVRRPVRGGMQGAMPLTDGAARSLPESYALSAIIHPRDFAKNGLISDIWEDENRNKPNMANAFAIGSGRYRANTVEAPDHASGQRHLVNVRSRFKI